MAQQLNNYASSTLSGSISAAATSLLVASPASFPATNDFSILIDGEIMLVIGVSGTTFTVVRGQEGTAATTHTSGTAVTAPLTSGALISLIRRDHVGAATPTGGVSGDIKIGNGVIWANDAGVWRATALTAAPGGPIITNQVVTPQVGGALITWNVSPASTGQIEYGLTTAYGTLSTKETNLLSSHSQNLAGLTSGSVYHYRLHSINSASIETITTDSTFTAGSSAAGAASYPADVLYTTLPTAGGTTPALPTYQTPIDDTTWGTKIVRISNVVSRRHNYSVLGAFNIDDTLILQAGFSSPAAYVSTVDWSTVRTTAGMVGNPQWSNTDPNKLFGSYSSSNFLISQDATTGAQTNVNARDFGQPISLGNGEGNVDDNDRFVVLLSVTGSRLWVYDIINNVITANVVLSVAPNNAAISRLGNYVTVNYNASGTGVGQGVWKYNRDMTGGVNINSTGGNHGDNGIDANGNEIFIYIDDAIKSYRLSTGALTTLLPAGTAFGYGHISCRNTKRNGWCYLSVYDFTSTSGKRGRDCLVGVKTDGSGTVEVFGFANNQTNGSNYPSQPQASVSRDGSKMVFASPWGTGSTVYDYVAYKP